MPLIKALSPLSFSNLYQERVSFIKKAFWKSSWTILIFAAADSLILLCVAFVLWYGDGLVLSLEYTSFQYMFVYVAVMQEPNLFDWTLRYNILLGVDEGATSEEQLQRACRDAEIHDFIVSLPDGYDTGIGTRGVAFSGGQKQRLAIARALIRNQRLLLLDEATSNLDAETERLVLATVLNADVILVLANGRLVEKWDHASLLSRRGVYYQMCQTQALDK
ncbi:hypothetical protein VTG60DRAFT_4168 [Thermothelomyces hinnuleus]